MDKDGTNLGCIRCRVEQLGFAAGSTVCAEEGFAFGPSAAACQALRIGAFGDEIGAVYDELSIDAQDGAESALDLCGRAVVRLQATYRGFNQRVQSVDVSFRGEAEGVFRLKCHAC
jgi:hypothetical protein